MKKEDKIAKNRGNNLKVFLLVLSLNRGEGIMTLDCFVIFYLAQSDVLPPLEPTAVGRDAPLPGQLFPSVRIACLVKITAVEPLE